MKKVACQSLEKFILHTTHPGLNLLSWVDTEIFFRLKQGMVLNFRLTKKKETGHGIKIVTKCMYMYPIKMNIPFGFRTAKMCKACDNVIVKLTYIIT